jgi:hypothetical protein
MSGAGIRKRVVVMLDGIALRAGGIGVGFSSRFLNCARMVILMECQCGLLCKGFLTVCIWTFVRSLARVDSALSDK